MTPEVEALIVDHLELVEKIATQEAQKLPAFVLMDDIVSAGRLGLVQAALRFDPARHASFAVWAIIRVRGAIRDQYRGRNYPRLTDQMPDSWLLSVSESKKGEHVKAGSGHDLPEALVDKSAVAEHRVIEQQENVLMMQHACRAHLSLPEIERRVLTMHLQDHSLREIGKAMGGKSGAWAHYTLHSAKQKMRETLGIREDLAA